MKVYITCPVTHTNDKLDLLPEIEKIVKSKGLESFIFKIGGDPKEIFDRDFKQLKSSDLIIAEVSELSHGVGIEIGLSFGLGLKRILLLQRKKKITKLAQGMPNTTIVLYNNLEDLKEKLILTLDKICA
ncbi:unnamed protein product [marine sediment metagenome]|uniref:Nucleoside 2-deoxyribosyltransferase n=1 Tax=marine sediment metagenome TaxID=412755 RepID=X1LG75_9ZZZZ